MKLVDLEEMATKGGDLSSVGDRWAQGVTKMLLSNPKDNKKIGMIDELEVRKFIMTYSIWDKDRMVAAARIDLIPGATAIIDDVWVDRERRGQKLFVKLLLFIKNRLKQARIIFGEVHSDDTVKLLKADGLKAFTRYWQDKNGEVRPFSPATVDEFYGLGKWKLVLESAESWEHLIRDESFTHTYESLAHAVSQHDRLV